MSEKKGISNVVIAIVVLCVVVIGVGLAVYFASNGGVGIIKPKEVTLTGTVTTTGTGTNPEKITFTSMSNNKDYVAACTGGGNPAPYSITLPNGDSYKVTITWKTLFGLITGGNADAGTLNLDSSQSSITENWAG